MEQISLFSDPAEKIVNVAAVPMRSPFRYAGGKTWLIPRIRLWLSRQGGPEKILIEPFAGGGIVSLTAVFEKLVGSSVMAELDEDVAAVWRVILTGDAPWLAERIAKFDLTPDAAVKVICHPEKSDRDRAFATIVKNRVNRGGILAHGAGFIKKGEAGKGIRSRWYPDTLKRRIMAIHEVRHHIRFIAGDGFKVCRMYADRNDAVYFMDPPYTEAGHRLYRCSEVDHEALFDLASTLAGDFLMTYNDTPEIRKLADQYGFSVKSVAMKNTHHATKRELLIGKELGWLQHECRKTDL